MAFLRNIILRFFIITAFLITLYPAAQTGAETIAGRDCPYVAYESGIVKDTETGLQWLAGPDRETRWDDALEWIEGLDIGGGGWRMPAVEELEALYIRGRGTRNMTPLLETSGWWVWSRGIHGPDDKWYVYFTHDRAHWCDRDDHYYGRAFAVRSGTGG